MQFNSSGKNFVQFKNFIQFRLFISVLLSALCCFVKPYNYFVYIFYLTALKLEKYMINFTV